MKNYRYIVPILLVGLMGLSMYSLASGRIKNESTYNQYLEDAREAASKQLTKVVMENYQAALNMKETPEIYIEIADYYTSIGDSYTSYDWIVDAYNKWPTNVVAVDNMLKRHIEDKSYESAYDVIYAANKRNVKSDYIDQISNEIAYEYYMDYTSYKDVGVFSSYYCPVMNDNSWGYVNRYGNVRLSLKYNHVGPFSEDEKAAVIDNTGKASIIDGDGDRINVSDKSYLKIGMPNKDLFYVQRTDKKYEYVNDKFETKFGAYDYATNFSCGVAAVKESGKWKLIDEKGNQVGETYDDIVFDEREIACMQERIFVKKDGKYILIDKSGKQIGDGKYDGAKVFGDSYAAVKVGNQWGFIDTDGKQVIECRYQNARSFYNDLAGVQINGKWGFIDKNGDLKINNQYYDVKDFNGKGSCFVSTGNVWQMIKLYRLNR